MSWLTEPGSGKYLEKMSYFFTESTSKVYGRCASLKKNWEETRKPEVPSLNQTSIFEKFRFCFVLQGILRARFFRNGWMVDYKMAKK